jgi:diguanylate cyclase (GGDEF)-like protein
MGPTRERSRTGVALLTLLVLLAALYPVIPPDVQDLWYDGVGLLSVVLALGGVRHHRPTHSRAWLLVIAGFLGWVIGDALFSVEQSVWHLDYYPVPSDGIYLTSYLVMGAGLLAMVRGRRSGRDFRVALDAAVIAAGVAVVAGVFVLAPIAHDSTLSVLGKMVSSAYPIADIVLIAILVRLWTTPGARSASFRLLVSALAVTLLADTVWNIAMVSSGATVSSTLNDLMWLASYVLIAAACWSRTMGQVAEPPPTTRSETTNTSLHLFALAGGLALPSVALLLDGMSGGPVRWQVVGVGSIVLCGLVLTRVAGLLRTVQVQAVQLAALARSDGLTGAPNRRTWDFELSRACQGAREKRETLCVALIDLDHFKAYNDTHGHQAGDLLLREAVALWTDLLEDDEMLARYGGEEFAVLLPGRSPVQARARIDVLRKATPGSQTFSAGVASWDPSTDPAEAVASADEAMYDAKRSGRNRVCLAGGAATHDHHLPSPTMVLQPIVDLATGAVVAMEALSRFVGEDTQSVFERAHQAGAGPELEAAAIRAALLCRPPGVMLSVNVSLASLADQHVIDALPQDLTGVTLEITEHTDVDADQSVEATLADLRRRGALIAVDDWGRGFSNLDRLLRLRPEMVKLDISLVHGLGSDYHQATIRSVVSWADEVGVRVCAEGVENDEQRLALLKLGVHSAQGYFFGRPAAPGSFALAQSVDQTVDEPLS